MQILIDDITNILHSYIPHLPIEIIQQDIDTAQLLIPNQYGGKPINIFLEENRDIKVLYNKTPRYFLTDRRSLDAFALAISEYLNGNVVNIDFLNSDTTTWPKDRIATSSEAKVEDLETLSFLVINKGLMTGSELEYAFAQGGILRINYWDIHKSYGYQYKAGQLVKITL